MHENAECQTQSTLSFVDFLIIAFVRTYTFVCISLFRAQAVAHAEGGKVKYIPLLEMFRKWVENNVAKIEPFLKSSALRRLLQFAVGSSSSPKEWNAFMSFLRTLVRVSCATQDKKAAITLTSQIGSLFDVVRKSAPESVGDVVREISLSIVEIYNFNGADVLGLDKQLKANAVAQAKAQKAPAGLKKSFELRDLRLQFAQLLRKKSERFAGHTVPADDITKGLRAAVTPAVSEEEADAIRKQHTRLIESLESYAKTRDATIRQIEEKQQRYRLKLDTLTTERAEHQKAIEELNAKIEAADTEAEAINQALEKSDNARQAAEDDYESKSANIKSENKDSFSKLQKVLDSKKVQDCIHALGGSISTVLSSINSSKSSGQNSSVSAFLKSSLQYFGSETSCVSELNSRLAKTRAIVAKLRTELSDFEGLPGMSTVTDKLKAQLEKQTSNVKQDEGVVATLNADSARMFEAVKALASHATSADKEVLKHMGNSLVKLGHEALWGKVEPQKPAAKPAANQKAAANPASTEKPKTAPAKAKKPAPAKRPVASKGSKVKFSWAKKKPAGKPVKSFAEIEEEQRQAALKQKETLRAKAEAAATKEQKKEADAKKAEAAKVLEKAAEAEKPESEPVPAKETEEITKEECTADEEVAAEEADALPKRERRAKRAAPEEEAEEAAPAEEEVEEAAPAKEEEAAAEEEAPAKEEEAAPAKEEAEEAAPAKEEAEEAAAVEGTDAAAQRATAKTWTPHTDVWSEFITYSDDSSVGQPCPDLSSMTLVPKGHHDEPLEIGKGKQALLVFFAKYIKYEAFPALEAGTKYCEELGIQTAGILFDHKEADATRFVEKKVSVPDYVLYHDSGWAVKKAFQELAKGDVVSLPSLFLVNGDGTIAWRQALSGNTGAMTFAASQFDHQIRAFVAGKELGSHGPSPKQEETGGEDIGPVEEKDVFATQEVADAVW